MISSEIFNFDNSYSRLPERFFASLPPLPVRDPKLVRLNSGLADQLCIDAKFLGKPEGLAILAGNTIPKGATPIAMAYAGFQFGHWVPQLGDGRAILLGEIIDSGGVRRDFQLKGSGPTPFSRMGDGRAALGPVLREYICSEAMAALGIPTTRSLAAITTGEQVSRERILPGGILTRIARSHVRVGTFQYFAARNDMEALRLLADYVIERHYPELLSTENRYLGLLASVVKQQALLVSSWQLVGFIHGVMNTDNMAISGETIDYGPCAFMDFFDPDIVYSSIDQMGRYCYKNQPHIAQWNLGGFAQTLLPLLSQDMDEAVETATEVINTFETLFQSFYYAGMRRKIGLSLELDGDDNLVEDLIKLMADYNMDFTLTFRYLCGLKNEKSLADSVIYKLCSDQSALDLWLLHWRARLAKENSLDTQRQNTMMQVNPLFIPRNHLVERVVRAAEDDNNMTPFNELVDVLARPYDGQSGYDDFAKTPRPEEIVKETFCGT